MAKAKAANSTGQPDEPAPAGPTFEDSIEQVEQIIDRIERGEQGLERSIADYERGAGLLKKCREILARSEQRIQEIEADLSAAAQPATRAPSATPAPTPAPRKSASTPPPPPADEGDDTPF